MRGDQTESTGRLTAAALFTDTVAAACGDGARRAARGFASCLRERIGAQTIGCACDREVDRSRVEAVQRSSAFDIGSAASSESCARRPCTADGALLLDVIAFGPAARPVCASATS
jgi:hypothetical protein